MGGTHSLRERPLELAEQWSQRQPPRAEHLEHALFLGLTQHGPSERNLVLADLPNAGHERWVEAACSRACRPATRMPYSRESTSASQEASMTFSDTPIEPHT